MFHIRLISGNNLHKVFKKCYKFTEPMRIQAPCYKDTSSVRQCKGDLRWVRPSSKYLRDSSAHCLSPCPPAKCSHMTCHILSTILSLSDDWLCSILLGRTVLNIEENDEYCSHRNALVFHWCSAFVSDLFLDSWTVQTSSTLQVLDQTWSRRGWSTDNHRIGQKDSPSRGLFSSTCHTRE